MRKVLSEEHWGLFLCKDERLTLRSTILVTNFLKHLCDFPLPNVDLGLQSFQCSKIRSEQHWGRRGAHLSENKDAKSECKRFGKNSRQMAPVSTICDEYCSLIRFYVCKNSFHHLGNRFPFSKWSFLRHHY